MESSTIRAVVDPTIGEASANLRLPTLRQVISTEWRQSGQADLVRALRRHPPLLRDRSLLLDLAIEEYRLERKRLASLDLEQHCQRFRAFGSSIQHSILRQLQAQRYIDDHPELLDALYSPDWPKVGEDFGSFHILEELGLGATAHVYLCRQNDVGDRRVVMKATPYPSLEACILGRLEHPNIIPILSTGLIEDRNLHYVCMPFCGRSTLTDLLDIAFHEGCPRGDRFISIAATRWNPDDIKARPRKLAVAFGDRTYVGRVLGLAMQIASALDYAHRQRILHGDLKPSNVLLTPEARPLLLDFNLSQDFSLPPAVCGGTLPYMPPEHLRLIAAPEAPKDAASFDPRPDIYSFGALLYELLTGRAPVALPSHSEEPAVIAAHLLAQLNDGPSSIRKHNPLVSRRIETLVLRCLAFDSADRPETMAEVAQYLTADSRSLATVARTARVRPLFFSLSVVLPLAALSLTAAYVAVQPPQHVRDYQQGLELKSTGELDAALAHYLSAVRSKPTFAAAHFELARTRLALGDIDAGMNEFAQLALNENDALSMAYMGYCFNLKRTHAAAIPWYERAIQNGAASMQVYNNLGASHLDGRSTLSRPEQLRLAEEYLLQALQLDNTSITVRLNLIRLATANTAVDHSYDPFGAWQHAKKLFEEVPQKAVVQFHVTDWYHEVLLHESVQSPVQAKPSRTEAAVVARQLFEIVYNTTSPLLHQAKVTSEMLSLNSAATERFSAAHDYFLEPPSLNTAIR